MKASVAHQQKQEAFAPPRPASQVSARALQERYTLLTAPLIEHFAAIDAWLSEQRPDLWQRVRQADDELFRLRHIGTLSRLYYTKLATFITLCDEAEHAYYDAQPTQLSLPPLAPHDRVAIYYQLASGDLHKASTEDE